MRNSEEKYSIKPLTKEKIKVLYCDRKYTVNQIAVKTGVPFWSLYNLMKQYNIGRRGQSEAGYLLNNKKPQFMIKSGLSIFEEKLKVAGIMLYWAEGTLRGNAVDFVNSNPYMIQLFLKFLRQICGVSESRLRLYLYAYSDCELERVKKYWHEITNIPFGQFTKPFITQGSTSNKRLPYGLVHIRYNDKKLLKTLESWIEEYKHSASIRVGTQVAKGGRLCKSSATPKGVVEK